MLRTTANLLRYYRKLVGLGALANILTSVAYGQAPSTTLTTAVLKPGVLVASGIGSLAPLERRQAFIASDGFGRPVQTVQLQASSSQTDIISFQQYDQFGETSKAYLPYARQQPNGSTTPYDSNPTASQQNFYQNADKVAHETGNLFSSTTIEPSPLARPIGMTPAGSDWAQHPTTRYASSNQSASVHHWYIQSNYGNEILNGQDFYPAQSLLQENSTDADGRTQEVYRDLHGRVLLVRRLASGETFDTYSIYDEAGQLRYLIPPAATRELENNNQWVLDLQVYANQVFVTKWYHQYAYDYKGRMVSRCFPGAQWVNLIYDVYDRVILTQDGNRRAAGQWYFTKFDAQGRASTEGIWLSGDGREELQERIDGQSLTGTGYELKDGSGHYTTTNAYPSFQEGSTGYALSETFYDDYDTDNNGSADYSCRTMSELGTVMPTAVGNVRGQLTVTKKRIVQSAKQYGDWVTTALFYDQYGNLIQRQSNSHLNLDPHLLNTTTLVYREHGFVPQVLRGIKSQQNGTYPQVTVRNRFAYDHAGRLLNVWQQNEWGSTRDAEILVARYAYNELGQMVEKNLHSRDQGTRFLQSVDLRYDLHGSLLSINNSELTKDGGLTNDDDNDVFGMRFVRQQPDALLNASPRFDGGLSAVRWQVRNRDRSQQHQPQRERSYTFAYDGLGRLNAARYLARDRDQPFALEKGAYDEAGIDYDDNGNLLTLHRYSQADDDPASRRLIDDLEYTYGGSGNQLQAVEDRSGEASGLDDTAHTSDEYTYDNNGSLLRDANKNTIYTYNALNKVARLDAPIGNTRYQYDAAGTVLRRTVSRYTPGSVETFDYVDGFAYETTARHQDLASVPTPEGRVVLLYREKPVVGGGEPSTPQNPDLPNPNPTPEPELEPYLAYEYHLRDHLNNLRVAFRATATVERLHLTMEPGADEQGAYPRFAGLPLSRSADQAYQGTHSARVTNSQAGPRTSIPVADGDHLKIDLFYTTASGTSTGRPAAAPQLPVAPVAVALAPALLPAPGSRAEAGTNRWLPGVQLSLTGLLSRRTQTAPLVAPAPEWTTTPPISNPRLPAYVRWTLYDEAGKVVPGGEGMAPAPEHAAGWAHLSASIGVDLAGTESRTGSLAVELVNEDSRPVYFDSVTIRKPQAGLSISQEQHYYPFGLAMQGVAVNTRSAENISKQQYNGGSQLEDETTVGDGAEYATFYRRYDPVLGRFQGVDPLANKYAYQSAYQYAGNDPVNANDPSGAEEMTFVNGRLANPRNIWGQRETDGSMGFLSQMQYATFAQGWEVAGVSSMARTVENAVQNASLASGIAFLASKGVLGVNTTSGQDPYFWSTAPISVQSGVNDWSLVSRELASGPEGLVSRPERVTQAYQSWCAFACAEYASAYYKQPNSQGYYARIGNNLDGIENNKRLPTAIATIQFWGRHFKTGAFYGGGEETAPTPDQLVEILEREHLISIVTGVHTNDNGDEFYHNTIVTGVERNNVTREYRLRVMDPGSIGGEIKRQHPWGVIMYDDFRRKNKGAVELTGIK